MRGKTKTQRGRPRLNASKKASLKRQGASAKVTPAVPKRVINNLASAMKSLEKAQAFFDMAEGKQSKKTKKKVGRPKKETEEQSSPA